MSTLAADDIRRYLKGDDATMRTTKLKRGDTGPAFTATCLDADGDAVDLSGGSAVFVMRNRRTKVEKVRAAATLTDAANGRISYAWGASDLDTPGLYEVAVEVTLTAVRFSFPNEDWHLLEVLR